jgi:hypothetical protein
VVVDASHIPCRNPTLREVWGCHSHSRKWDLGVLRNSRKLRTRLQGSKHLTLRCFLYCLKKVLKWRCSKWPRMSHLDICSTSYGWKKGRESNWQFDFRPLKVRNRPDPGVCRWNATHRWKALKESYKFASDLIPIRGLNKKLWMPEVLGVQTGIVSGLHLGSPGKKCHLDASATEKHREYYMGEGGGFPRVQAVVSQVSPRLPVACPNTKSVQNEF